MKRTNLPPQPHTHIKPNLAKIHLFSEALIIIHHENHNPETGMPTTKTKTDEKGGRR